MGSTKLKDYLKRNHITQSELSNLINTSSGNISSICSGKRKASVLMYQRIADALGCDLSEICDDKVVIKKATGSSNPRINFIDPYVVSVKLTERKIKHKEMAEMLSITPSGFSKYMRGICGMKMSRLKDMADLLDCEPKDLLLKEDATVEESHSNEKTNLPIEEAYMGQDEFNNKNSVSCQRGESVACPPAVVCKKCGLDPVKIQINSDISYPPSVIRIWIRYTLCHMMDPYSPEYDPIRAGKISDCFFKFYVNKKKPLREDARYFVREKDGKIFLKRDHGGCDVKHTYIITRGEGQDRKRMQMVLSESEKEKFEDLMTILDIPIKIRSIEDIL